MSSKKLYFTSCFSQLLISSPQVGKMPTFTASTVKVQFSVAFLEKITTHLQVFVFPTDQKNSYFRNMFFREVSILRAVLRHKFYQPRASSHGNAGTQNQKQYRSFNFHFKKRAIISYIIVF